MQFRKWGNSIQATQFHPELLEKSGMLQRIWDTFHCKVPMERAGLRDALSLPTSSHYIAARYKMGLYSRFHGSLHYLTWCVICILSHWVSFTANNDINYQENDFFCRENIEQWLQFLFTVTSRIVFTKASGKCKKTSPMCFFIIRGTWCPFTSSFLITSHCTK